jgi:hypothetical protein
MSSYPGAYWPGHTAPATLAGPPTHEDMHEDVSDEIVAMQGELGTNPSGAYATVTARLDLVEAATWTTFTPTWTNLTVGNATQSWAYCLIPGKSIRVRGNLLVGSTTSITGAVQMTIPASKTAVTGPNSYGAAMFLDAGTTYRAGVVEVVSAGTLISVLSDSGSVAATVPFTWAVNDVLGFDVSIVYA